MNDLSCYSTPQRRVIYCIKPLLIFFVLLSIMCLVYRSSVSLSQKPGVFSSSGRTGSFPLLTRIVIVNKKACYTCWFCCHLEPFSQCVFKIENCFVFSKKRPSSKNMIVISKFWCFWSFFKWFSHPVLFLVQTAPGIKFNLFYLQRSRPANDSKLGPSALGSYYKDCNQERDFSSHVNCLFSF